MAPTRWKKWLSQLAQFIRWQPTPRPHYRHHRPLWLEALEDRVTPASTITVIATVPGSLDAVLVANNGIIKPTDGANGGTQPETLSATALSSIGPMNAINVAARTSIAFNALVALDLQAAPGVTDVFSAGTGSISFARATDNVTTGGGALLFSAGTDLTLSNLTTNNGNITLFADNMTLATLNAGTGGVYFDTQTRTRPITVGTTVANTLSLLQADLNRVTAAVVRIGDAALDTGGLNVTAAITAPNGTAGGNPGIWDTLDLRQQAAIAATAAGSLMVSNLAVTTATGAGTAASPIKTAVSNFAAKVGASGLFVSNTGALTLGGITSGGPVRLTDNAGVTVSGGITLIGNGGLDLTAATLTGSGPDISLGANTFTATVSGGGTGSLSTIITGVGGSLVKAGPGTLSLGGTAPGTFVTVTYTGPTTVNAGTLLVNDSMSAGGAAVAVNGGTLGGVGLIQRDVNVNGGGTLAPGVGGVGVLSTGNLTFAPGSFFSVNVNGTSPGGITGLVVAGTVNLGNATLQVNGGATPAGSVVTLIANDSITATASTFNGRPEGATVTAGAFSGLLTYAGNDGNDVTLTVAGPAALNANPSSPTNAFVLRKSGGNLQLLDNGNIIDARPLAAVTDYAINAGFPTASLTIDLGFGGYFRVGGVIAFHDIGGSSNLGVVGGNLFDVSLDYFGGNYGNLAYEPGPGQGQLVTFDIAAAVDLSGSTFSYLNIELTAIADTAALTDHGTGAVSTLVSGGGNGLFPITLFRDPAVAVSLKTKGGNDNIDFRRTAPSATTYFLDAGTGDNALNVDLSAAAGPDFTYVTAPAVQSALLGGPIYYAATGGDFAGVMATFGDHGNFISVQGTQASAPTLVRTGGGDDTVLVASSTNAFQGKLDGLAAPVVVDAGAGSNQLSVSDAAQTVGNAITMTNEQITTGVEGAVIHYRATGGDFKRGVALFGGSGDDTLNIACQLPGAPFVLYGGNGNDLFQVALNPNSAYKDVILLGGDGVDSLVVFDQTGCGRVVLHPADALSGAVEVRYTGAVTSLLGYQNLEQIYTNGTVVPG